MSALGAEEGRRYSGKVCLVTGGSSGIGKGIVTVFVKHGANVVFCDINAEVGQSEAEELEMVGPGTAAFVYCDVTKEEDIKNLIDVTVSKFGRIDCLVNNAGCHPPEQKIDEVSADEFRRLFDVNVMGYFLMSKHALPHLRKVQGCIINNASMVAHIGQASAVPYVATKGAVSAMTKAMAIDEAKFNVRVNAFSPGQIWTPMFKSLSPQEPKELDIFVHACKEQQVLGRFGTPEEAGYLCLFLAADATYLTGVDIPLSGGAELGYGQKIRLE